VNSADDGTGVPELTRLTNRLGAATSPYLQQHRDNPVAWQEWGDEAFEAARRLDRPVLLSVGYAACHWCHVMAHESFEDEATAAFMNEHFVNVKVDREELGRLSHEFSQQILALEEQICGEAGCQFTIGSPQQLGNVLFDKMGLKGGRKGKSGVWSTDVTELERLAKDELPGRTVYGG